MAKTYPNNKLVKVNVHFFFAGESCELMAPPVGVVGGVVLLVVLVVGVVGVDHDNPWDGVCFCFFFVFFLFVFWLCLILLIFSLFLCFFFFFVFFLFFFFLDMGKKRSSKTTLFSRAMWS